MDILFKILDSISWRPDYLPPPGRSLPQVHFDAPRLLSHVYLYEIDRYLKKRSGDNFVRWVDDITVAAASREDGKKLLRDLDQLLMTRCLRLNAGKTRILSAAEAAEYFHRSENRYLDGEFKKLKKFAGMPGRIRILRNRAVKAFDKFAKRDRVGHWDKVMKRYLTLFTKLADPHLIPACQDFVIGMPVLRDSVWRYFAALGPERRLFDIIRKYLTGDHALDDSSIFQATQVLVDWKVMPNSKMHKAIKKLGIELGGPTYASQGPFYLVCALWLVGKYGFSTDHAALLQNTRGRWIASEMLARQVAATFPKLRSSPQKSQFRRAIEVHKFRSANSVLMALDNISSQTKIDKSLRLYILNGKNKTDYSLSRFLIAIHALTNKSFTVKARQLLKSDLLRYLSDPIYLKVATAIKIR